MIKFRADLTDGRHLIGLGLSEANLTELRKGHPIAFDLDEILPGSNAQVVITWGQTEEAIRNDLEMVGLITSTTIVRHDG